MGLDDDPFSWQIAKDGRVLIFRDGRQVAVIAGAQADRLRPKLANAPDQAQQALARATGNYRQLPARQRTAKVARLSVRPSSIDDDSLITDRLVLAPLRLSDAREMQSVLASPALYRFTGGSPPSLEQLMERYRHQIAGPDDPDVSWHNWIIRSRTTGSAVGFVQATVTGDTADIAWPVGVPWQRQGFAVEFEAIIPSPELVTAA